MWGGSRSEFESKWCLNKQETLIFGRTHPNEHPRRRRHKAEQLGAQAFFRHKQSLTRLLRVGIEHLAALPETDLRRRGFEVELIGEAVNEEVAPRLVLNS